MDKAFKKETIKAYLLGRISEEETLAGIEEALFFDDGFAGRVELTEDEIIDDYVFGNLNAEDRESAENFFFKNSERQFKLKLTEELKNKAAIVAPEKPHLFETLKGFFRQPAYVGAFAVLLVVVIGLAVFLSRSSDSREMAELRLIYQKDRSVQTRISDFDHAPLNITRGENEDEENKNKLQLIQNRLLEAVVKNPTAENRRALGVFHLTQRNFADAIGELEKAAKLDDKNAKIANDLGSAYFEMARKARDENQLFLGKAFGSFQRATELDPNLLEALFNKSFCLQEQRLYNEAKKSWNLYLEKDPNSGWAQEARKHLESLENLKKTSKTKEQVLEDFLNAFRGGEEEFAWKINCQTKEMLEEVWLPGQLTRRYLEAERDKRQPEAKESIEALNFIGEREKKAPNADFFVADLAEYYSNLNDAQIENLLKAKDSMKKGLTALKEIENAKAVIFFEESAKLFSENGNVHEEKIAEYWAAQCKPREGKVSESLESLKSLAKYFDEKKYKLLHAQTILWMGSQNYFLQNEFTKSIDLCKKSLTIFVEIGDTYGRQKSIGCLINTLDKLDEARQGLQYLGQMPDVKDLYFYSEKQAWRDRFFTANLFNRMKMFAAAESFGRESLSLANAMSEKAGMPGSSFELLAKIYTKAGRLDEALNLANESKNSLQNKSDGGINDLLLAKATLPIAEIKRQMEQCDNALNDYDAVIRIYSKLEEIKLNNFVAHKGKLLCFQALNKQDELETELQTVLESAEQYRSQILKDDERQTFFDSEQFVYDVAVENALAKGDPSKAFALAESSKARSLLDFVAGKNSIADLEKQFSEVSKPLSMTEIQARMPERVQIVQFAVLREKTVAWTVTKTGIKPAEIKISADALQQKVSNYLRSLNAKTDKTEIERSGRELYDLLFASVIPSLDPEKEICFVPDKALHGLPFAALVSERGRFLLEDFRIFYSPSASIFVFASEKAKTLEEFKDERLLSVGNPAFDTEKNAGLNALPGAEDEARTIAEFYPQPRLAFGAEATKTKFLAEMPGADVIHFAGHYVANGDAPSYSRLLFSAVGEEESDLRVFEIAAMKLPRAKLVVLSACQTGIEKFYEGEGAIGIARTFLAVGAPLVAASSWKVDSEATKELMIEFHRNRREKGRSAAEALRQAQIKMLRGENEDFRQPYFWAAFSIIGGSSNY